ncbi:BTAD domain-containing putative transcriptional regulator [Nocardioides sp.]|uniref:BTAD domain-containing putative transcriptional regulator n=1 Tax=Nocardioides sp. TaxID=35761 RepID=UPI0035B353B7
MRISVLGSSRVTADDGTWLDLGSRKPRAVLAALAMRPGRPVSAELLVDLVWAGEPPRAAHGALHAYISGLRKSLEPDRPARSATSVLETTDHGYVLRVPDEDVDARAFAAQVRDLERVLAPLDSQLATGPDTSWPTRAEVVAALDGIDAALASWTGEPYADLPDHPDVLADRAALEQLRAGAEEARLLGLLALGEHASVLSTTEAATGRHPLRERLWAIHALALTRSGRQADALEALRTVRSVLAEELGLDPGAQLRTLEEAILRQEPALLATMTRPATEVAEATADAIPVSHGPVEPVAGGVLGRTAEREALAALVAAVRAGSFGAAQLVGEPGIGKSRLVDDLVATARGNGLVVAVGRCSEDDGAPPLWPWRSVLRDLGVPDEDLVVPAAAPGEPEASPEQRAFRLADLVADLVVGLARAAPTAIVLDDLQWADDATLRTLAHLVSVAPADLPLLLVVTRRTHPEPSGALAAAADALARRHALHLELTGLASADAAALVRSVRGPDVDDAAVARWAERAAGNPFFLIELARLGATDTEVPATVRDVVTRRLGDLPADVLATLQTASVVGERFHVLVVSGADDRDVDDTVADLEAAQRAGLVRETDVEEFGFAHALTRDAVLASLSGTQAARRHARVAHALETRPEVAALLTATERTAELARHWLAAGSSHVETAWRAARTAADQARRLTAFKEAVDLRAAALAAHRRSPGAADAERYDLLLELATDAAYAARWPEVEAAAIEGMALGRALGQPELVGRAAAQLTLYCVWQPHASGVVVEDSVDDLRWALAHLPDDDLPTRARLQLALAVELYFDPDHRVEMAALVDSGMALARRVADPHLRWWAARAAWTAMWMPEEVERRTGWTAEGLAAARADGDAAAEAVHLVAAAVDAFELARREEFEELAAEAERIARRERLPYVLLTLLWLRMSLATIRGDQEQVLAALAELGQTAPLVAVPHQELQSAAAYAISALWSPEQLRPLIEPLRAAQAEYSTGANLLHAVVSRAGTPEELAEVLAIPVEHEPVSYWASVWDWCTEAEAAFLTGDRELARRALDVLAPFAGRLTICGAVFTLGPLDGYLALCRATLGEPGVEADVTAAVALAKAWDMPEYVDWLTGLLPGT